MFFLSYYLLSKEQAHWDRIAGGLVHTRHEKDLALGHGSWGSNDSWSWGSNDSCINTRPRVAYNIYLISLIQLEVSLVELHYFSP